MASSLTPEANETILCEWQGCSRTFSDPEAIYAHLCDDHVGRKSTGNLCLDCKWKGCEVTCATKRHHITSHLIVHVPFKPHGCPLCDKTFKRPQDLKKHERTHTGLPANGPVGQTPPRPPQVFSHPVHSRESSLPDSSYGLVRAYPSSQYQSNARDHPSAPPLPETYHPIPQHRLAPPPSSYPAVSYGVAQSDLSSTSISSRYSDGQEAFYPSQPPYPTPPSSAYDTLPPTRDAYRRISDARESLAGSQLSYQYLAHGSNKRDYDAMAVGDFLQDAKRKRVAPTYDTAMAERLINTFGDCSDLSDLTFESLLPSEAADSKISSRSLLGQPGTQAPDADLNSWLLQLGAAIAQETSPPALSDSASTSSPSSGVDSPYAFDVPTLESLGLTNIPGWDEALLTPNDPSFMPKWLDEGAATRPIAHLPSRRERQTSVNSESSYSTPPPAYSSPAGSSSGGYPSGATSFDSIRSSRGKSLVAQLAPIEHNMRTYRHIEPLTRAPPLLHERSIPRDSAARSTKAVSSADSDDEMDDAEGTPVRAATSLPKLPAIGALDRGMASYKAREQERSVSPSSTDVGSQRGLYPMVGLGNPSRRLPSPTPSNHRTHANPHSIASILASPYPSVPRSNQRSYTSSPASRDASLAPEDPPRSLYPSLRSLTGNSSDGMADEGPVRVPVERPDRFAVAAVPMDVKRQHLALIKKLLVALNSQGRGARADDEMMAERERDGLRTPTQASMPGRLGLGAQQHGPYTLPPLRRLSSASDVHAGRPSDYDATSTQRYHTPPQPTHGPRQGLPGISQLLLNAAAVAQGQGMAMDVDG